MTVTPEEQKRLELIWQGLSEKYHCGRGYCINCVPGAKPEERLDWDSNTRIRGEVDPVKKVVYLYDTKDCDRLECLIHEFFEVNFNDLIQPYVSLCNTFEESINKMIKEQNELSAKFMRDSYMNKEDFISKFVALELKNIKKAKKK